MSSTPVAPVTNHRIHTGELTIAVKEYGQGRDLVLIHGIGSTSDTWRPVIDELADAFRLFAIDLRGHGESDKPDTGYLVEDYARDLQGVIGGLGLEQPLLMGHSLGGMTTMRWAIDHPLTAKRIVLEDPPLRPSPNAKELFAGWIELASLPIEEVAERYKINYPEWSEEDRLRRARMITATALPVFTELRDAMQTPGAPAWIDPLAVVETPMLLINGEVEFGGAVAQSDVDRFAATAPNARSARIAGAGHSLHRDHTAEFLALAVPFLIGEDAA
jgi:pimeloyl-ACP methyl ester carboxylesterase